MERSSLLPWVSFAVVLTAPIASPAAAWRSSLYPADWTPGVSDASGRFLHDFSYAGYHGGAVDLPAEPPGPRIDASAAPYGADPSGATDATAAIQRALDDAAAMGGAVVELPPGTYRIRAPAGRRHALFVHGSGVVLRGAGSDRTFLLHEETDMRLRYVVQVAPREEHYAWMWDPVGEVSLRADVVDPTTEIPVSDASGFAPGDWVILHAPATEAWIAEHGMTGTWTPEDTIGPMFYRRVEEVRVATHTLVIDAPTRYPLRTRDGARVFRPALAHLEEVGVEGLSIGNLQNDVPGTDTDDYAVPGTGAYQMHASFAVHFDHVVNGWIRDVRSFRPAENGQDVHLLSGGVRLEYSRFVTVTDTHLARPQYRGAGGNGYLFVLNGNDCLITRSSAERGRHNYSFSFPWSNGNVIHRSRATDGRLPTDFHQRLSFANLIDNLTLEGENIEAVFRDCCNHGHSATQNVFWNTEGLSYARFWEPYIVHSQQYGHGYVIGTRGPADGVYAPSGDGTAPVDFVEGEGRGATLEPASLFEDQRSRRLGVEPPPVDAGAPSADAGSIGPGPNDAGPADAGGVSIGDDAAPPLADGGSAVEPAPAAGCGCRAAGATDGGAGIGLIALALIAVRRRRSRSRDRDRASRTNPTAGYLDERRPSTWT